MKSFSKSSRVEIDGRVARRRAPLHSFIPATTQQATLDRLRWRLERKAEREAARLRQRAAARAEARLAALRAIIERIHAARRARQR